MAWLTQYASTIIVLLILLAVVGAILRSMIRSKALTSCGDCSGNCAGCGGVCPTASIELSPEQRAQLDALELGKADRT